MQFVTSLATNPRLIFEAKYVCLWVNLLVKVKYVVLCIDLLAWLEDGLIFETGGCFNSLGQICLSLGRFACEAEEWRSPGSKAL